MADDTGVLVLPEHECWKLMRSTEVGRLAVSCGDGPDIFPINFVVDHGSIVFRTAPGSKLSAMATSLVAFEVDGYDPQGHEAWSVVIKGRGQEIKQLYQRIESMDLPLFPWHAEPKGHFVRIEPTAVSGRRFHVVDPSVWATPTSGARPTASD
jgi:nitroimidazol reductase NimA-like FMN-containing flavoprotein (pyridoxamine 5'-phosphate oxidase superfamily)